MKNKFLLFLLLPLLVTPFIACEKVGNINCYYQISVTNQPADTLPTLRYDSCVGFLFYADTLTYTVDSYEQARSGQMVKFSDRSAINSDLQMKTNIQDTISYFEGITRSPATLVVCDTVSKLYAYRMIQVVKGLNFLSIDLAFKPYQITATKPSYKYGRWMVKK